MTALTLVPDTELGVVMMTCHVCGEQQLAGIDGARDVGQRSDGFLHEHHACRRGARQRREPAPAGDPTA